jgi:hypothetical protein
VSGWLGCTPQAPSLKASGSTTTPLKKKTAEPVLDEKQDKIKDLRSLVAEQHHNAEEEEQKRKQVEGELR